MSDNPNEQIFSDLFRYLEVVETQNAAILQLLKDKKVVSEKKFASYLEQAAVASDVKWRAARVRMEHLLASAPEPKPEVKAEAAPKTEKGSPEAAKPDDKQPQVKKPQQDTTADESRSKSSEARTNQTEQDQRSTSAPEVAKDTGQVNEGQNNPGDSKNRTPGDSVSRDSSGNASSQSSQPQKVGTKRTDEPSPEGKEEKDERERLDTSSGENQQSSIPQHSAQEKVA